MKILKKNRTFFAQPIPKITPLAQTITSANESKCLSRLNNQNIVDQQQFLMLVDKKKEEVSLTLYNTCIMGEYSNKEKFQICFEYLSYENLENDKSQNKEQQVYGFVFFKNFEELEIFTPDQKIFKQWGNFFRQRLIAHDFHESYDVKKMIGKGHFAKVYYAVNRETQKPFAIKAFSKEGLLSEKNGQESIINEIFLMRKLNHPHCLRLYEVYETEHSLYFVIELISGGELLKRIASQKKFHESDVKILMRNLLTALNHCHKNLIMHRDLKPENLLLRDNTNIHDIVIADFGLATQLIEGKESEILFKRCGTPGYVAPEVLKWKDNSKTFYDFKCDIFSAGCIFFLLISGKKAFEGDEQQEVIRINRECSINFSLCKTASPEGSPLLLFQLLNSLAMDLLQKMLDPNPETRITISNALNHIFLYTEEENIENLADEGLNLQNIIQTIGNQDRQIFGSQQGSFADSFGSFHLNQKPLLNGEINTIEKVNENMQLNSELQFKTKKPMPLIKQSSYGRNRLSFDKNSQQETEESKNNENLQSAGKKQVNQMHKKAIMNNMMKGQGTENATVSPEKQPPKLAAAGKSSSFKIKKTSDQ